MNYEEIRFSRACNGSLIPEHKQILKKKNHHIVFYSEELEDINLLLEGKIDNYSYFPVKETDNFIAVLEEKFVNLKGIISLSIVCHGTEKGLKIGRDVFDENKISSFNTISLESIKINEIFLYSCQVGKNVGFINYLSEIFKSTVYSSKKLVGHSSLDASWELTSSSLKKKPANNIRPFSKEALSNWNHSLLFLAPESIDAYLAGTFTPAGGKANPGNGNLSDNIKVLGSITVDQAKALTALLTDNNTFFLGATILNTESNSELSTLTPSSTNFLVIKLGASATAQQLKLINNATTGDINAASLTTVTGVISDMVDTSGSSTSHFLHSSVFSNFLNGAMGSDAKVESDLTFTPTASTQASDDINTLKTDVTNISLANVTKISTNPILN